MMVNWVVPEILAAGSMPYVPDVIHTYHKHGIGAVVTLTCSCLFSLPTLERDLFHELGMDYFHSPIVDQEAPDTRQVNQVLDFIDEAHRQNKGVFVHCRAGNGRTGTILHSYFLRQGLSLNDAKQEVRMRRRQSTKITPEQERFLVEFEGSLT